MRKSIIFLVVAALFLFGCKKNTPSSNTNLSFDKNFRGTIGIAKIISHPALDDFERGVIDGIKEKGYNNIKFDIQNANGEISSAILISNKFKTEKVAVAVAISTPMAQALANNLKNIPVVFGAVTDPVDGGIRTDLVKDDVMNVAGVSDLSPVRSQIVLATELLPIKKLGIIYNAGEANSLRLLEIAETVCKELGIELVKTTVANTSEVKQATEIIAPLVDIIYVTTDNVVYAALNSVTETAMKSKTPVIAAVPDPNPETGSLASYGIDYYMSGKAASDIIIEILSGKKAGDIPVKYLDDDGMTLYINEDVASKLNITVSETLLKQASPMNKK